MTKFCPECGTKQREDSAHYCSNCGFDFSKLEEKKKMSSDSSDRIDVPIVSSSSSTKISSSSSTKTSSGSSASSSSSTKTFSGSSASSSSSTKTSSGPVTSASSTKYTPRSSTKATKTYNSHSSKNDFLSNLSFNKCFLAFAVLLIIMVIGGMILEATETEPYSDDGLTSFMYESNNYDLNSFLEDSNNYYDDSDSDYLSYGYDDISTILNN